MVLRDFEGLRLGAEMPGRRKRYDEAGKPNPCVVRIPPALSPLLYREKRARGHRDEAELVCATVRKRSEDLERVDWVTLLAELKAEGEAARGAGALPKRGATRRLPPEGPKDEE